MLSLKPTIVLCALASVAGYARAADPQPYRVELAATHAGAMDAALKATSDLVGLRASAPVSPFGLIARARGDVDRLTTVLESFGFYQSRVVIKINGIALTDPQLADALVDIPARHNAAVRVDFQLGTQYTLRHIEVDGAVPAPLNAQQLLGLAPGEPAIAEVVLAAGNRLLAAMLEAGYAFAKVDPPVAVEAADSPVLDLTFTVAAGPQVNIGEIKIVGLTRVHEALLRRRLTLHTGERFRPSLLERARRDLLALNIFAQVSVQVGNEQESAGGVPVTFKIRERARHAISLNAAYSTDLGGSGGVTWTDRDLLGNAEQLAVSAAVIDLGGSDTDGTGYDTSVKYTVPEFLHRDQSLQASVTAIKQYLQAYDQTAETMTVAINRKLSSVWAASAGVSATYENIVQFVPKQVYKLVALPLTLSYDSTDLATPLDDPLHGLRGSLNVAPTLALGSPNATFLISQVKIAGYFDLEHLFGTLAGRTVLAARALAGSAEGAGEMSLPPDQRFYAGGSGTIRGFAYQRVGPTVTCTQLVSKKCNTGDPIPTGGTAISSGGIELRQRFGGNLGAAFFLDGGQVTPKLKLIPQGWRYGAGVGIRYYTAIGPIRFDVAAPTQHRSGDDSFEIYIGIGQAF